MTPEKEAYERYRKSSAVVIEGYGPGDTLPESLDTIEAWREYTRLVDERKKREKDDR